MTRLRFLLVGLAFWTVAATACTGSQCDLDDPRYYDDVYGYVAAHAPTWCVEQRQSMDPLRPTSQEVACYTFSTDSAGQEHVEVRYYLDLVGTTQADAPTESWMVEGALSCGFSGPVHQEGLEGYNPSEVWTLQFTMADPVGPASWCSSLIGTYEFLLLATTDGARVAISPAPAPEEFAGFFPDADAYSVRACREGDHKEVGSVLLEYCPARCDPSPEVGGAGLPACSEYSFPELGRIESNLPDCEG